LDQVTKRNFTTTTTDGTPLMEGDGTAYTGLATTASKQSQQASNHNSKYKHTMHLMDNLYQTLPQ
jgi:hypothetical protein